MSFIKGECKVVPVSTVLEKPLLEGVGRVPISLSLALPTGSRTAVETMAT